MTFVLFVTHYTGYIYIIISVLFVTRPLIYNIFAMSFSTHIYIKPYFKNIMIY